MCPSIDVLTSGIFPAFFHVLLHRRADDFAGCPACGLPGDCSRTIRHLRLCPGGIRRFSSESERRARPKGAPIAPSICFSQSWVPLESAQSAAPIAVKPASAEAFEIRFGADSRSARRCWRWAPTRVQLNPRFSSQASMSRQRAARLRKRLRPMANRKAPMTRRNFDPQLFVRSIGTPPGDVDNTCVNPVAPTNLMGGWRPFTPAAGLT
jgi:hypothetical protein